jgi:heparinase II/III-like protein
VTALRWKLARLSAMPAGEIVHRARVALRDRVAPPDYAAWGPGQAAERLYEGGAAHALATSLLPRWPQALEPALELAPAVAAARELLVGRWSLFGRDVRIDDPPRWNRNPVSGAEWPDEPSAALDYRRADVAGGAKLTWEFGRLTPLPTLALAARLTGERAFAERAVAWLADFTERNPIGHGIHHTSGIEMALRVLTSSWTLALLGDHADRARVAPALGLVAQQALHCRDHLSLGSSANNHLIAEYAAMATIGAAFPSVRDAASLLDRGLAGLERECLRQIHQDGVTAEQAFGYLPFVWELFLIPFAAAEAAGQNVSAATKERLRAALEFARAIRLPDGRWPQIGDEDDAGILLAYDDRSRLDRVGNALAAWLGADALCPDEHALARLLFGRAPGAPRAAADGRHEFPHGGYTLWRERGLLVTFDHGPLGLEPLAAHGHADALAITVFHGVDPIVADPGTLAYHEDPAARDLCRSTPAHGTVCFGARTQSEMLGPFLWGRRARVAPRGDEYESVWASGERHARRVEVADGLILIHDRVRGEYPALIFPLAPGAKAEIAGTRATIAIGGSRATFEVEGAGPWQLVPTEHAPRFARREPSTRLMAVIEGSQCRTEIRIE